MLNNTFLIVRSNSTLSINYNYLDSNNQSWLWSLIKNIQHDNDMNLSWWKLKLFYFFIPYFKLILTNVWMDTKIIIKFQWWCFIGTSLWRTNILAIITLTILKSLRIIICHKSNSILELLFLFVCLYFVVCLSLFQCFLYICILLFVFHPFNVIFILSIYILLWTFLFNQTFISIFHNKSRM
jgi:hypothetical protein